jgi:predicted transcriptional regulator
MKEIVMSIKPEAVRAIASGRSRAEIKKEFPHFLDTPFRVYIYEMSGALTHKPNLGYTAYRHDGRGMVVGEAICHDIKEFTDGNGYEQAKAIGMTMREISAILDGKQGYVFYFTDVKMYGVPKPVEAFGTTRPPQSWFYVKEGKENE